MSTDMWTYPEQMGDVGDLEGFDVQATDGGIGEIDEATYDVGSSYVVVDTGPWIFGKKVLIPGSAIQRIDLDRRTVELRLSKDQIRNSPEFDDSSYRDDAYRTAVGDYYGPYV